MELCVNGNTTRVGEGISLAELLAHIHIDADATGVAVAVNDAVVPRRDWESTSLSDGDDVEVIHAVQGG
jgi:sulfur carrier protein